MIKKNPFIKYNFWVPILIITQKLFDNIHTKMYNNNMIFDLNLIVLILVL